MNVACLILDEREREIKPLQNKPCFKNRKSKYNTSRDVKNSFKTKESFRDKLKFVSMLFHKLTNNFNYSCVKIFTTIRRVYFKNIYIYST